MNQWNNFSKGFFKENAVFVLLLGLCPSLAVTSTAINSIGMGIATTFVLIMSNVMVSLTRNFIPNRVRIPSFIVIIASFVTVVELFMKAYLINLYERLGIFVPLIVVNCIVLGRAEAFGSKNKVFTSFIDGLGMGLGFTMALTIIGSVREAFGTGSIFGYKFISGDGILVFVLSPGAFFVIGYLLVLFNKLKAKKA